MSATAVADVSRSQASGFLAPAAEVRIEGVGLPGNTVKDITRVVYRDCVERIDSFEMTVDNWDGQAGVFKYIGSETASTLQGGGKLARRHQLFEPGNKKVELLMGYVGSLSLMMTGTFTSLEPSFCSSGPKVLTVRCLDALHKLRRKPYTTAWRGLKDSEIAEQLAQLRDGGDKRFPLPIRTDPEAKSHEEAIPYVIQDNQYDIDFLLTRARRLGYVIAVEENNGQEQLYFGPSLSRDLEVVYELEWGKSLTGFHPTLTTAHQIRSATVHGWNRETQQPIAETVDVSNPRISINRDLHRLLDADRREEHIVDEPMFTPRQARERATNFLLQRMKQMVVASVTTIGLPGLRAGRRVRIKGVGARLSGTYFITDSIHTYSTHSGYKTRIEVRREDRGDEA